MTDRNLLRAQLLIEAADILNEDAVAKKNANWLKRYNYRPLTQSEKERLKKIFKIDLGNDEEDGGKIKSGYITVDGKKILVIPGKRSPVHQPLIANVNSASLGACTTEMTNLGKNLKVLHLGGRAFSELNDKEKDYVLNHELGHLALEHTKSKSVKTMDDIYGEPTPDSPVAKVADSVAKSAKRLISVPKTKKAKVAEYKKKNPGEYIKQLLTNEEEARLENMPRLSKHIKKLNPHSHPRELEADIYSLEHTRTDPSIISSSINKVQDNALKYATKDMKKFLGATLPEPKKPGIYSGLRKRIIDSGTDFSMRASRRMNAGETKSRIKAAKDKKIDHTPYKK